MADPSQPSVTTQGNTQPVPEAQPQRGSTRLAGATVTEGGTTPFSPPPQRQGNPQDSGAKPFRVGGG